MSDNRRAAFFAAEALHRPFPVWYLFFVCHILCVGSNIVSPYEGISLYTVLYWYAQQLLRDRWRLLHRPVRYKLKLLSIPPSLAFSRGQIVDQPAALLDLSGQDRAFGLPRRATSPVNGPIGQLESRWSPDQIPLLLATILVASFVLVVL